MRFAALATGAGVSAGDFVGMVVAIHSRVCLLSLADESLLMLATPALGRLPRSITLDAPAEFAFRDIVAVGAHIATRSGILRIGGSPLSIDLRPAIRWRSCLSDLRLDGSGDAVTQAMKVARAALYQYGRSDALVGIAGARLAALATATRRLDAAAAAKSASGLVGLGEGATPAGDDYLVGYFGSLWACAGRTPARMDFIAALGERLKRSAPSTSRISRAYLEAAIDGEVSERLVDLASCIAAGSDSATVGRAAAAALAVGYSSGACGLLGFFQACACWSRAAPPNWPE